MNIERGEPIDSSWIFRLSPYMALSDSMKANKQDAENALYHRLREATNEQLHSNLVH